MTPAPADWHKLVNRWKSQTVLLVGSGPSLLPDDIARAQDAGWAVFACNDNHIYSPDLFYVADWQWLAWEANLGCLSCPFRWMPMHHIDRQGPAWDGRWNFIKIIDSENGLLDAPGVIASGDNAGHQMISLAVIAGAARIVLTGYDMQPTNGLVRWRGTHPSGVEKSSASKFPGLRKQFEPLAADCASRGVEVINATRETALECFPRAELRELLPA